MAKLARTTVSPFVAWSRAKLPRRAGSSVLATRIAKPNDTTRIPARPAKASSARARSVPGGAGRLSRSRLGTIVSITSTSSSAQWGCSLGRSRRAHEHPQREEPDRNAAQVRHGVEQLRVPAEGALECFGDPGDGQDQQG